MLLLVGATACGEREEPLPGGEPVVPAEKGRPPVPPTPMRGGARGGKGGSATDPEVLPRGGAIGGGSLTIAPVGEGSGGGQVREIRGTVYVHGGRTKGAHRHFLLTTRPRGTTNWPWLRLETWIPAKGGLEAWIGRPLRVYRLSFLPAPGFSPWTPDGPSRVEITGVEGVILRVELQLRFRDPLDGLVKVVGGNLAAVPPRGE